MADVWYLLSLPFLQITADPVFVQDDQLIQYLVPVAVSLRPFLHYILTGQIQHLFQCSVAGKHTFCFGDFPILPV